MTQLDFREVMPLERIPQHCYRVPEDLAAMRADLKRAFDCTDEEADQAMRNICF